jgi:uncharacterized protein YegP (UPF0339 family)
MYFQIYRDAGGYWRWRLRAANHLIIADCGGGYEHKNDCLYGIQLVQSSNGAPVYEV